MARVRADRPSSDPTVGIACFSPTGITKKVCEAIAAGISAQPPVLSDLVKVGESGKTNLDNADLLVIGSPVYVSRLPLLARERISSALTDLKKKPLVAVSVYGDVALGIGLKQLVNLVAEKGFKVVGAGAFIGEHFFKRYRSAGWGEETKGRPDDADLQIAKEFGTAVRQKGLKGSDISSNQNIQSAKLSFMGRFSDENGLKRFLGPLQVDASKCSNCQACVEACPAGCLDGQTIQTLNSRPKNCNACTACMKACPNAAISQPLKMEWLLKKGAAPSKTRGTPIYYT